MNPNHTPGRLEWAESPYEANLFSIGADGKWLMSVRHNGEPLVQQQRENMRRLVACWNACEGLSTEALERSCVAAAMVQHAAQIEVQRYDLHKALRALVNEPQPLGIDRPTYQQALALIDSGNPSLFCAHE